LLLRSGNECAFPGCTHPIFNDEDELVAECCHIEAALPGGERFNADQSNEQRRQYNNLLFMCNRHHEARFREKPIKINPKYIDQVIDDFSNIKLSIAENLERTKKIEKINESILENITSLTDILACPQKFYHVQSHGFCAL
jgi:hypothetical protein